MKNYYDRAEKFAVSKLVGAIHWKRRDEKTYMFLGDVVIVQNGKSKGLEKALLLVSFDKEDTMYFQLTIHPRAPEIFMAASFHTH